MAQGGNEEDLLFGQEALKLVPYWRHYAEMWI